MSGSDRRDSEHFASLDVFDSEKDLAKRVAWFDEWIADREASSRPYSLDTRARDREQRLLVAAKRKRDECALQIKLSVEVPAFIEARGSLEQIGEHFVEVAKTGFADDHQRALLLAVSRTIGNHPTLAQGRGQLAPILWRKHGLFSEAGVMFEYARADAEGRDVVLAATSDTTTIVPSDAAPAPTDDAVKDWHWIYVAQAAFWRELYKQRVLGKSQYVDKWLRPAEDVLRRVLKLVLDSQEAQKRAKNTLIPVLRELDEASGTHVYEDEVYKLLDETSDSSDPYQGQLVLCDRYYKGSAQEMTRLR